MYNSKNGKRMSTMSLEAEKTALIRQILDVDDIAILKKIRSMLNLSLIHIYFRDGVRLSGL